MPVKGAEMKQDKTEAVAKQDTPATFTKAQILASARYANRKDVLGVILTDKAYTLDEVNEALAKFMKGSVK